MSTGKIVIGGVGGRIRWFLDKQLLRHYPDSMDHVVGIAADGLRLEISENDGPGAAPKAAHNLCDMAALAMRPAKVAA